MVMHVESWVASVCASDLTANRLSQVVCGIVEPNIFHSVDVQLQSIKWPESCIVSIAEDWPLSSKYK